MFAAKQYNVVSQNLAIFKNNPGQILLLLVCMLLLAFCLVLNFSAIGQMVSFGTGIHPFMAVVSFIIFTQLIKYADSDRDGIGKYVSQALYLTMSAIALYWVFTYSDWTTYSKVILSVFHMVIYGTIIEKIFIVKK